MANISKRTLIVLASCLSVVLVIVAAGTVWFLQFHLPAGSLPRLPKETTLVVVRNGTQDEWLRIAAVLNDVPPLDPPATDAALLRLPDGTKEWVRLTPGSTVAQGSEVAVALLRSVEHPVQHLPLVANIEEDRSWILVGRDALPPSELAVLPDFIVVLPSAHSTEVRFAGPSMMRRAATTLRLTAADASLFVRQPQQLWNALERLLPAHRMTVLATLLHTLAATSLGPEVSPVHDLPQLLDASITVARTQSGHLLALLESTTLPQATRIEALHDSVDKEAGSTVRLQTTTKEGFTINTLQAAPAPPPAEPVRTDGWLLRSSAQLYSASRGMQTVLATTDALRTQAMTATRAAPPDVLLGGILPPDRLFFVVTKLLPEVPLSPLLRTLPQFPKESVWWDVSEKAGIWSLTIRTELDSAGVNR